MIRYAVTFQKIEEFEVEIELDEEGSYEDVKVKAFAHHYGSRPTRVFKVITHIKELNNV